MAKVMKWFVIINPTSGNGSSKRKWPMIQSLLDSHDFDYSFAFTSRPKHSIDLVQNAVNQVFENIICIGGDGTIHNIVNGIMTQNVKATSKIILGVIPIGTGNDWVKTYGIPKDIEKAIQRIKQNTIKCQDIGKIEFLNIDADAVYFNNLAGVGFDGHVVSKVKKYKNLGATAYLAGAIIGLLEFRNFKAVIEVDTEEIKVNALMILIGLCTYSGGGMRLTKNADPEDGNFDITLTNNFGKFDVLKNIVRLFNGKVTSSKKVRTIKASLVKIHTSDKNRPLIQADGELIGEGGIKVTLIPKAFTFYA
jgi:YegS/Rv2252/BmrU family lipid kinase